KLTKRGLSLPAGEDQGGRIRLNLNENPFGPSPLALAAIEQALSGLHRYPPVQPSALEGVIARFHDFEPEEVMVAAGATELLGIIAQALLGPGKKAITSALSFLVYRLATEVSGGELIEVETRGYGYDLDGIAEAIDENTRVVFVANPNNPTGSLIPAEALKSFVDLLPDHVLLVLDEAYFDFAHDFAQKRGVKYFDGLAYVRQRQNVLLLRTFSKAHGLAGLRVGYGIGAEALISLLKALRSVFSVSSLAAMAASAALFDRNHVARTIENNRQQADVLASGMRELGVVIPETWTNFLYCELGQNAAVFAERLRHHGIIVQPLTTSGAPTAMRVTIGTAEENARLLEVLSALPCENP
ncbi:MAG: histidinol-phosphate transaminase, partial [Acidobacteria bacterium]|nr:histidinol-phosphate transaminase [Acidobacteriota bacterium]